MKFQELSENAQKSIRDFGIAYYLIKGVDSPEEEFKKFTSMDYKNSRRWRAQMHFKFMRGIDKHRAELGLKKLYTNE